MDHGDSGKIGHKLGYFPVAPQDQQQDNGTPSRCRYDLSAVLTAYPNMGIMPRMDTSKLIVWVGSSLKDLQSSPDGVRSHFGYALRLAQLGDKHPDARPLKGYGGSRVLEVVVDDDRCTYRGVYSVEFEGVVFALHVFQKKSTKGSKTPDREMNVIDLRRKEARRVYEVRREEFERLEATRREAVAELRRTTDAKDTDSTR